MAEVHWFEEPSLGKVKFKVVDWLDLGGMDYYESEISWKNRKNDINK